MRALGKKILIIDDEIDLAKIAKQRLEASEYRVVWAKDGDEGVKMAKDEKPDIILLDVLMPKKDGFGVLHELKSDMRTWGIPVIMLTIKSETDSMFRAQELGAVDYFIKTDDWKELIKYVRKYLGE